MRNRRPKPPLELTASEVAQLQSFARSRSLPASLCQRARIILASGGGAVGDCGDNAACEGFFGMLKRERVHSSRYLTLDAAKADVFEYIERFHKPRMRRRGVSQDRKFSVLSQPSVISFGVEPAPASRTQSMTPGVIYAEPMQAWIQ